MDTPSCVKLLIPHSNCKADDCCALKYYASNGDYESVKLLIPLSDCEAEDSYALKWAAMKGNLECVELLLPHSNIDNVINQLLENNVSYYQENIDKSLEFINNYLNQKQKDLLLNEINQANHKSKRKI